MKILQCTQNDVVTIAVEVQMHLPLSILSKMSWDHDNKKLEDQKVPRRSPNLFNNVKICQGKLRFIIKHFVLPYMGVTAILVK